MPSGDSGRGESFGTPLSASKRPLVKSQEQSSSKRSLFGGSSREPRRKDGETSGDDSDLGPMSPLALTDGSDSDGERSPGRSFVSSTGTPEKRRPNSSRTGVSAKKDAGRTFDALRNLTRVSRLSPNRKILIDSDESSSSTPRRNFPTDERARVIGTTEREAVILSDEDTVPETPSKVDRFEDRAEETPEKSNARAERRLVTPLSCVSNDTALPRLHRRKSLCSLGSEETASRRTSDDSFKRRAPDHPESVCPKIMKYMKIDENKCTVPKARASLFPETRKKTGGSNDSTVSTKTFYKSTLEKRGRSFGNFERASIEKEKKRHGPPSRTRNPSFHGRSATRKSIVRERGEMNAGVRHGIKRPKPKRHVSRIEAFKTDKPNMEKVADTKKEETESGDRDVEVSRMLVDSGTGVPRPPSPIPDPTKRFFKTNRTLKSHADTATVTVNDNIRLKVSGGKIALRENKYRTKRQINPRKRARLEEMSFDASDLTVDEPNVDESADKRNLLDGILEVLEKDWADDEYDTMETLTFVSPIGKSRARSESAKNPNPVTMSPASVLSDMTLSMNIEDSSSGTKASESRSNETGLYPLFRKGYSSSIADRNRQSDKRSNERGVKRSWQTSLRGGGALDQYQIDAGQKRFGATACNECGVVYQRGEPEDENAHLNYHNNFRTLRFSGWKNERVVTTDPFANSRIVRIEPGDSKQCWKKVEQVLAVVDKDLGLAEMEVSSYLDKKIYFYVRNKTILGVLVAESIKSAHLVIPEFADLNCCSAEETPAKCGINVIWTAMSHRRRRIATKLVDCLRTTYYFGYIMTLEDIAFSMPTPSGKLFAEKYTKTRNFKVYT